MNLMEKKNIVVKTNVKIYLLIYRLVQFLFSFFLGVCI